MQNQAADYSLPSLASGFDSLKTNCSARYLNSVVKCNYLGNDEYSG